MRIPGLILILLSLPAAALGGQARPAPSRDSAGVRIVESRAPIWTAQSARRLERAPGLTIGSADGDVNSQFGRVVGAVRLGDGSVVVADTKNSELRLFSASGAFVRKIGQRGQGPGDFAGLWSVIKLPGDTILTTDYRSARLTWFTADGKVRHTLPLEQPPRVGGMGSNVWVVGMLRDGSFIGDYQLGRMNPKPGLYSDSLHVVHANTAGRITPSVILFRGESYSFETGDHQMTTGGDRPFTTKASLATGDHSFFYTSGVRPEIAEFGSDGRLQRIIRLGRALVPVTSADIARFREQDLNEVRTEKFNVESSRGTAIKLDEAMLDWMPFPKTMPAFTALQVDPSGGIWAREYGDSTKAEQWEAFDRTGRWLGTVAMPAGFDVFEIGLDYVLGRVKDEDDVESVRLYRLLH